jgi:hypothetical protein
MLQKSLFKNRNNLPFKSISKKGDCRVAIISLENKMINKAPRNDVAEGAFFYLLQKSSLKTKKFITYVIARRTHKNQHQK